MKNDHWQQTFDLIEKFAAAENIRLDGRLYTSAAARVRAFRRCFEDEYSIETSTEWLNLESRPVCAARAIIKDRKGRIVSTGTSMGYPEKHGNQSFVETAETQAVGRALGFLGFGGDHIATSDEVKQLETVKPVKDNVIPLKAAPTSKDALLDSIAGMTDAKALLEFWAKNKDNLAEIVSDKEEMVKVKKAYAEKLIELEGQKHE